MSDRIDIINYPKSLRANLAFRGNLLRDCESDIGLQQEVNALCSGNILLWINLFCTTKDPRRPIDVRPFITYAFQDIYIKEIEAAIDDQHDVLTEKSRDVGVSWMVLYVFTHKWLFESGSDFRVGSRKEDFVDKLNDIDTLLEKVRFTLKNQPAWLLPKGFNPDKDAGYMRIINPENNNSIIGESANPHFGSGGRRKAVLLDEFAKWDVSVADAAWTATADVTRCRIPVSTPVGSGNKFAQLANGTNEKIKKVTLHWTLHPIKSEDAYYIDKQGRKTPIDTPEEANAMWKGGVAVRSPWYDAEEDRRSEADLAQEVDIDYLRSGHPFFNQTALKQQIPWTFLKRHISAGEIPYGSFIRVKLVELDNKIEIRELDKEWLRIFELPVKDNQYVVSADVSEGLAKGDESFITVRDKLTRNVVASANGLFSTDDLAIKAHLVGKFYNGCEVAPENNNHGHSVCQDLKKVDCKLYWTEKVNAEGKVIPVKPGWTTTSVSRPEALDQLEEEIRKNAIELRCKVIIDQCKTFVKNPKTGKPEADGSFLDDGVIATAIGGDVIKRKPYKHKDPAAKYKRSARRHELANRKNGGISFKRR